MATRSDDIQRLIGQRYKHGFVTDIESESLPPGLDDHVIRLVVRTNGNLLLLSQKA